MSLEVLDQLENKIKQAVETIQNDALRSENEQLRSEHQNIQERLRSLLGITDSI